MGLILGIVQACVPYLIKYSPKTLPQQVYRGTFAWNCRRSGILHEKCPISVVFSPKFYSKQGKHSLWWLFLAPGFIPARLQLFWEICSSLPGFRHFAIRDKTGIVFLIISIYRVVRIIFFTTLTHIRDTHQFFRNFLGIKKMLIKHEHDSVSFQIKTKNWNHNHRKMHVIGPYPPF